MRIANVVIIIYGQFILLEMLRNMHKYKQFMPIPWVFLCIKTSINMPKYICIRLQFENVINIAFSKAVADS